MDRKSIDALLRPDAYPHPVGEARCIETHISWVLLAGDLAYKIKKPVDFGFLDFSTPDKHLRCCEEEVRLNRRWRWTSTWAWSRCAARRRRSPPSLTRSMSVTPA